VTSATAKQAKRAPVAILLGADQLDGYAVHANPRADQKTLLLIVGSL